MRQICNYIPPFLVPQIARTTGAETKARSFSPGSHAVSLLHRQLSNIMGLDDLCDALQLHSGPLVNMRGATPSSRNGLSNADRKHHAAMAEQLICQVLDHLSKTTPGFVQGRRRGAAFRFKQPIHAGDNTVMELEANYMDWAQQRRRKAAAKTHMRLNLQSLLPNFVIIDTAGEQNKNYRTRELYAGVKSGEINLFCKGTLEFEHLWDFGERNIWWVTRAKDNMAFDVVETMPASKDPKILRDEITQLRDPKKTGPSRCGVWSRWWRWTGGSGMVFLTNNLTWSSRSVADLYRCRWQIEVSFKQIKQTLLVAHFPGHNANAVRRQVWMALLVYLLLRYLSYVSYWGHSFTRLFTILRAVLWAKLDLQGLLDS